MAANEATPAFIEAEKDLRKDDPLLRHFAEMPREALVQRWQTPEGKAILTAWEKEDYQREALDRLVGRYYGHTDLRGAPLRGRQLSKQDLSRMDFFAADLSGADLAESDLTDSWLSHANLQGTRLDFSNLTKALVDDVQFDDKTSFLGVNLAAVNFNLAVQLQNLARRQQWIFDVERNNPRFAAFLRYSCDYGRSFGRFGLWVLGFIVFFGILYHLTGSTSAQTLMENLYFSVVTFTTLGYGDIHPVNTPGMVLVILQVGLGYLMLGLLVAMLSKRLLGE